MKFYKSNSYYGPYLEKILSNKLNAIYCDADNIAFYRYGLFHNAKNVAWIYNNYSEFMLDNICYGTINDFTKKSWRRFVKMQVFK